VTDIRCVKCNRLLLRAIVLVHGEIKCPKCGFINNISKSQSCDYEQEKKEKEIYSE